MSGESLCSAKNKNTTTRLVGKYECVPKETARGHWVLIMSSCRVGEHTIPWQFTPRLGVWKCDFPSSFPSVSSGQIWRVVQTVLGGDADPKDAVIQLQMSPSV